MTDIYNIVKKLINPEDLSEDVYFGYVPENVARPYHFIKIIGDKEKTHKDDYLQKAIGGTTYKILNAHHKRYRIQVDYVSDNQIEAYADATMRLIDDNVKDYIHQGYSYDVEHITSITRTFNKSDLPLYVRTVDKYLHRYKLNN